MSTDDATREEAELLIEFCHNLTGIHEQDISDEGNAAMKRLVLRGMVRHRLSGWWELTDTGLLVAQAITVSHGVDEIPQRESNR